MGVSHSNTTGAVNGDLCLHTISLENNVVFLWNRDIAKYK